MSDYVLGLVLRGAGAPLPVGPPRRPGAVIDPGGAALAEEPGFDEPTAGREQRAVASTDVRAAVPPVPRWGAPVAASGGVDDGMRSHRQLHPVDREAPAPAPARAPAPVVDGVPAHVPEPIAPLPAEARPEPAIMPRQQHRSAPDGDVALAPPPMPVPASGAADARVEREPRDRPPDARRATAPAVVAPAVVVAPRAFTAEGPAGPSPSDPTPQHAAARIDVRIGRLELRPDTRASSPRSATSPPAAAPTGPPGLAVARRYLDRIWR